MSHTENTAPNPSRDALLARYLPPIPDEFAVNWVRSQSLAGQFILDPFGASPDLIVKAAQSGGRVIVAANNPILQLLIELAAKPPTAAQARASLSALAALRVREMRIELHIQSLYQTTCPTCEEEIYAAAYLWEREAAAPYARILDCKNCQTAGEFPLTEADIQNAAQLSGGGLHHARALGRIAPPNDPDREHVEAALNVYPPRAVYALLTLVNKLDQLNISAADMQILQGMLLQVFDQANTLWPHPIARDRPRQLTIPPTYREQNIWQALEAAADLWAPKNSPVPVTYWPALPPESGGICLFEGRIRDLAEQANTIEFTSVVTIFPRPNQAFWALSALWSGWLWGHEAVEHFKSVLRRRRYDWAWHSTAVHAALQSLRPVLAEGAALHGLIGEAEPGFLTAIRIAAAQADLQLTDFVLYADKKLAALHWQTPQNSKAATQASHSLTEAIRAAARAYLLANGEPAHYLQLHAAILAKLDHQYLCWPENTPADNYTQSQQAMQESLTYRNGFLRFGGSENALDVGQWWLSEDQEAAAPLADRVEMGIVQYLRRNPNCSFAEVEAALINTATAATNFSGLLRPETALICECLESYGEKGEAGWLLREQDTPAKRREEIGAMLTLLADLGQRLGFAVQSQKGDQPQSIWRNAQDTPCYIFYLSASALLGKYLLNEKPPPARGVIVLPGGRANLVMFKLNRDPRLRKIFEQDWHFLKYRHARQLKNNAALNAENLAAQLALDPLTYNATQLRMF